MLPDAKILLMFPQDKCLFIILLTHKCICSFLRGGWHFHLWLILWSLHNRVVLYLEPLKRDYRTSQLDQFLGMKGVHWSSTHFCHLVNFQLQGLGVSSLLQCPFLNSAWGLFFILRHPRKLESST